MSEERMSSKQYAKYEKVFFLFGSVSKMVSPVRPDEWEVLAEKMWTWAIIRVNQLVEEYTEISEAPPPEPPPPEPSEPTTTTVAYVSEAQAKRFYALANGSGKNKEQIKDFLAAQGIANGWKIPVPEYDRICALVQK